MSRPLTTDESGFCYRIWEAMLGGNTTLYVNASRRIRCFVDEERKRMKDAGESPLVRNPFDSVNAAQQSEAESQLRATPDGVNNEKAVTV